MDCCKLPDQVQKKLDAIKKELRMKKISKVIRVAGELSWKGWDQDGVVDKLYPEFARVEKQGLKTKRNLQKIAEALTRELKGLNYNFPQHETFCLEHMWFAKDAGEQPSTQQKESEIIGQMPLASRSITRTPDVQEELPDVKHPRSAHKDTEKLSCSASSNLESPKKRTKAKDKAQAEVEHTQTCPRYFKSKQGRTLMHAKDYRELFLNRPKI